VTAIQRGARVPASLAEGDGVTETLRLPVAAEPAGLAAFRTRLRSWLGGLGAPHQLTAAVLVAAEEAVNNAIEHADTAAGASREQPITLTASRTGGGIEVAVTDPGPWRSAAAFPERGRGHGLELMRAMMTTVSVETGTEGTIVTMHAPLSAADVPAGDSDEHR
jgi:anti-sigma regulatory factor (Ser/Thr protein kinase)